MQHDAVVLSSAERAALAELVMAMPAEDAWLAARLGDVGNPGAPFRGRSRARTPTPVRTALLLAAVTLTSLLLGAVLAVLANGDVAWSGWLIWACGTLVGIWLVVVSDGRPLGSRRFRSMA